MKINNSTSTAYIVSLDQWFSTGEDFVLPHLPTKEYVARPGDIFLCPAVYGVTQSRTRLKWLSSSSSNFSRGNVNDIQWVEARDVTKHPKMHRTPPHNKELANPKPIMWRNPKHNTKFLVSNSPTAEGDMQLTNVQLTLEQHGFELY